MRLVLHDSTTKIISDIISRPGFYILQGPSGIGKKTALLNQITPSPVELISPDGKSIKVETVKRIAHTLSLRADAGFYVIIDDADLLTDQAQNALLKTLEELPDNVSIIMVVSFADKLLPTIRSRAIIKNVARPTEKQVLSWLSEYVKHEDAEDMIEGVGLHPGRLYLLVSDKDALAEYRFIKKGVLQLLWAENLGDRLKAAQQLTSSLERALELSARIARYKARQVGSKVSVETSLSCEYASRLFTANCNKKLILDSIALRMYK